MTDYDTLFAKAEADLKDANERYRQAAVDSMDAAFRGLVFACAAEGVATIHLSPSDQGDYMHIDVLVDEEGEDHEELEEAVWNYASDLTDYPDAPWRIMPGVTPDDRGYVVTIDVNVAAEALLADANDASEPIDRTDAAPVAALAECHDLWASGAWDDSNAVHDLAEVMGYIERLLGSVSHPCYCKQPESHPTA